MNYILGVSGSISAYKAYDVLRGLIKDGHEVKVVMTKGAENFVQAQVFEYLGASACYKHHEDFSKKEETILHIDLKNWMDRIILCPLSANTMAKLANGLCDDLLSSLFLSSEEKDKILFPAMNTSMYKNTITQENITRLQKLNRLYFHPPASGLLACGEIGEGKLPPVDHILDFLNCFSFNKKKERVLILTGATVAPLDPIRYLTNPSSGKTGIELARVYLQKGHPVTLMVGHGVSIPEGLIANPNLRFFKAKTTQDMFDLANQSFDNCDIYISSAAISDIEFKTQNQKIKKSDNPSLDYDWAVDILSEMLKKKKHQKIIGFAAETTLTNEIIQEKYQRKPVDLLIANEVDNGINGNERGFRQDQNEYHFIQKGKVVRTDSMTKYQLAQEVYRLAQL